MRPTFRTDLTCSREEQQGVVFYRIDDPKSQTSFRLYEIEHLIAKKLDGSRSLLEVITAVKQEFNFDISEPDLQRFVNQLESMGFLHGARDGDAASTADEPETQVMAKAPESPTEESIDLLGEAGNADSSDLDQAEFDRLLRAAFTHVKQGYVVHARDYFLAARELNPTDERLSKLVNHLEIIGDTSGPAEVEFLWNQAKELFPELVEEFGPLIDARSGGPMASEASADDGLGGEDDMRSRVVWFVTLLTILVAGLGGLWWVVKEARLFESAAHVRVATLNAQRLPIYYSAVASNVTAAREEWLSVGGAGEVAAMRATVGARVERGEVIVSLGLPDKVKTKLAKATKELEKAEAAHEKAAKRLQVVQEEREAVEAEKAAAEDRLKELRPKSVLRQGGVSKRDLEKWKQAKVAANKKLTQLAKKARKPRGKEGKARKKRDAAARKLAVIEKRIAPRLVRAPFTGVVVELKTKVGAAVAEGEKLVLLRDTDAVKLRFEIEEKSSLRAGGEAWVSVSRGVPGRAKVIKNVGGSEKVKLEVRLDDPSGGFVDSDPGEFRLVKEFAEEVFTVPTSAIVEQKQGPRVVASVENRAAWRDVELLQSGAATSLIRDASGTLRDKGQIVVVRLDEGELATIVDGSSLEVEK